MKNQHHVKNFSFKLKRVSENAYLFLKPDFDNLPPYRGYQNKSDLLYSLIFTVCNWRRFNYIIPCLNMVDNKTQLFTYNDTHVKYLSENMKKFGMALFKKKSK